MASKINLIRDADMTAKAACPHCGTLIPVEFVVSALTSGSGVQIVQCIVPDPGHGGCHKPFLVCPVVSLTADMRTAKMPEELGRPTVTGRIGKKGEG